MSTSKKSSSVIPHDKNAVPPSPVTPIKRNWLIYQLYVRHEFQQCLEVIDDVLENTGEQSEYALYVKALIFRQRGKIQESLELFQQAASLNSVNTEDIKQVARSLFLLGRNRQALEVYEEALKLDVEDWEIWHSKGLCYVYLKDYKRAIECFEEANSIGTQRHDITFVQLGKVHVILGDYEAAIGVFKEALEYSKENSEILTTIGLLYVRLEKHRDALFYLGQALALDPYDLKGILAAGSMMQDHNDMKPALMKYRVAATVAPNSAQLWNNVAMCFFGQKKYTAAIVCLKRALYLDPFEWIVSYNLGLVHLNTGQYASAFHYLSATIHARPDFASSYMYLAIALVKLDDYKNACHAYEKAIEMEQDHMFHLNYAVTLFNHGDTAKATQQYQAFQQLWRELDAESKQQDPDVFSVMKVLDEQL